MLLVCVIIQAFIALTGGERGLGKMAPYFLVSFGPVTTHGPPYGLKHTHFPDSLIYSKRLFPLVIIKDGAHVLLLSVWIWTVESRSKRKKSPFLFPVEKFKVQHVQGAARKSQNSHEL